MKIVGVIPARYASTRFPGKVLTKIAGKPMIQHVWERAKQSKLLKDVLIACDHPDVMKEAQKFGAKAVMTRADHPSGTDRIAEVVRDLNVDGVINIQGDEPLMKSKVIDDLAKALIDNPKVSMATVIKVIVKKADLDNPNVVKVVIDQDSNALYFSRSPIPYERNKTSVRFFKHLGIYAYRKDFLLAFTKMRKSKLEEAESLEQLRALEAGYKIKTVETDIETIGVDTKEDLAKVEALLK
jgi:3-deoxy-manno-octulosonate cytidylyltransferase (CMP-KDO synthetase)